MIYLRTFFLNLYALLLPAEYRQGNLLTHEMDAPRDNLPYENKDNVKYKSFTPK